MVRDIDDIADDRTRGVESTGEQYHDTFLRKRPQAEWSPHIDATAKDLNVGIQIGDLTLTEDNFGRELGYYYRRGLKKTAGRYADLPSVLDETVDDADLGMLAYKVNQLSYEIASTDLGVENIQRATEALIEKLLTRHVGADTFGFIQGPNRLLIASIV